MAFSILNFQATNFQIFSQPDAVDFDILVAGIKQDGIVSGCAASVNSPADMDIDIASGTVRINGTDVAFAGDTVTIGASHASNERLDLITIDSGGTAAVVAGTPSTAPALMPSIPSNEVVVAVVYVPGGATEINGSSTDDGEGKLLDKRVFVPTSTTPHNLLSTSHGDVSADTVSRGSIIYGNSTPAWDELTIGANTRILGSDGTDISWVAQSFISHANLSALTTGDPHTQYRLESEDHTHQSTGAQAGKIDHGAALDGLTDDDHTQYLLLAGRSGQDIDDNITISGYLRVGSATDPANTTAGDLSATRLNIGDEATALGGSVGSYYRVQGTLTNTSGTVLGNATETIITPASNSTATIRGHVVTTRVEAGTGVTPATTVIAAFYDARLRSDSALTNYIGFSAAANIDSSSPANVGAITTFEGFRLDYVGRPSGSSTLAITTLRGLNMRAGRLGAGMSVTDFTDIYIENPGGTSITNVIGIDIEALSRGSSKNVAIKFGDTAHIFEFPADATDPTSGGGAATGRIPVLIGGSTFYLAYY